jgi:hypothetical protein
MDQTLEEVFILTRAPSSLCECKIKEVRPRDVCLAAPKVIFVTCAWGIFGPINQA